MVFSLAALSGFCRTRPVWFGARFSGAG